MRGVARRFPLCLLLEILPRPPPAADKGKSRLLCNNGKPARPCQPGRVRRLKDFDSLLYFDIFRLPKKPVFRGFLEMGKDKKAVVRDKKAVVLGQKSGGFRTKKRWPFSLTAITKSLCRLPLPCIPLSIRIFYNGQGNAGFFRVLSAFALRSLFGSGRKW